MVEEPPLAEHVRHWDPRREQVSTLVQPRVALLLASVLTGQNADEIGVAVPPMWHGPHFADQATLIGLGEDGHPLAGPLYPPIPRRTRMFVGGRLTVLAPLRFDREASMTGEVVAREIKHGRTGEMLFVTVRRTVEQAGTTCLVEDQDVMYRSGTGAKPVVDSESVEPLPVVHAPWSWTPVFGPAQLFTYSAMTANAHRIHYDTDYARNVEGYPGLVVHGPLLVLSMLELVRIHAPGRTLRHLSYRLRRPVILGDQLRAEGEPDAVGADLLLRTSRHDVVATARVEWD